MNRATNSESMSSILWVPVILLLIVALGVGCVVGEVMEQHLRSRVGTTP